ncbi:unnamed protein product, partial [Mesorhabditis belari]|uniref:Ion channel n=1 Tax=Mesorhabditis belari TaxID=2138241 RepID=A0AAF3FB82_9BILA
MTKEAHRAIPVLSTPTMSVKQNHDRSETTTIAQEIPPPTYTSEFSELGFPSTKSLKTLPESGRGSSQTELIPGSSQNHFMSSVYWLVNNHRKFAIRQILLVLAFTVVALLGGVVFYYSEKGYEKRMLRGQVTSLNALLADITTQFENVWNEGNSTDIQQFLRNSYKEMLQNENRYQLSALWKYDDGNYAWQYWPSVFYQTNIFMGVDYGNVPNQNGVGRLVLVITTCITLSLAQVVARDLGHWYLFLFTKLYAWINTGFRKAFELKPLEEVELPLLFCFGLLLGSWCLVSAFICGYDAAFGEDGINYWLSFYLAYETVTTIGVGDVMPKYTYKAPLWKFFCFFFGTPFRAVNHSTFVVVERSIFYPLTRFGDRIADFLRNRVAPEDKNIAQMTFPKDEMDQGMRNFITDRRDLYGGQYGRVRINANELDDTNDQKDQKDIAVVAQI